MFMSVADQIGSVLHINPHFWISNFRSERLINAFESVETFFWYDGDQSIYHENRIEQGSQSHSIQGSAYVGA